MKTHYLKSLSAAMAAALTVTAAVPLLPAHVSAAEMEKVDISGGTFSESLSYEGYEGHAMDGDLSTQWAAKGAGECWLQADFDKAVSFNCIKIYETQTYGPRMVSVTVQTSDTGEEGTWTDVQSFSDLDSNGIYDEELVLSETLTTSHVRLVIDGGQTEININEVEFYNRGEDTARDKLGALIAEAEAIDTRLYKVQTSREFTIALASANTVYNNENMLDGQINDAAAILSNAMDQLEPLGENLALNASATANSTYEGSYDQDSYGAEFAVDGNLGTRWSSRTEENGFTFEITLDLGEPKTFNQLILFETLAYSGRIQMIDAQVSDNGTSWEDWRMDAEHIPSTSSLVGGEVTKQYVRITMTGNELNLDEIGLYNDADAIETTYITDKRPIDPNWIKPIPSEAANTYQLRKQELGYGMFIHYGVNTFTNNEWGSGSEDPSVFNPNPETYDPEQWAKTAWEAGMNYIVLITKHHDGFAMFDTQYSEHKVTNCGHEGVDFDVVEALAEACHKYGIKLGLYYSIWDMNWEQTHPKSNYVDERAWDQAYTDFAYNQIEELMTNYGDICELWIDGGWVKDTERWEYERIYDMVKRYQPGCQMSVNLTLGDRDIASLQGGEEIVNFPSDFKLYDGRDTSESGDPKVFTYQGENYYLPFEGTFIIGNGWFWNTNSSENTLRVNADQIKNWYDKYQRQDNTLVINVPPSDQGIQTDHEISLIYEAAREIGIARGDARADISPDECAVEIRHITTSGSIAAPTEYIYGTEGEAYTTSAMDKMEELGYELTGTPAQASGIFGKDKITVEYVYTDLLTEDPDIPPAEQTTGKATLEYFLNQAEKHLENGDVDSCVESVQKLFAEAVAEGKAVMSDEAAVKEEVLDAALKLMKAIHALDMRAADKTDLEMAVELAEMIDLADYTDAGQKAFTDALAAAEAVLSDGDAFQEDADKAWDTLVTAMENLRLKADKSVLEGILNDVESLDLSRYTEESAAVFRMALANAQAVMADGTLTDEEQETVDDAAQALSDAKEQLQLKPEPGSDNAPGSNDSPDADDNPDADAGPGNAGSSGSGRQDADVSEAGGSKAGAGTPKTGDRSNWILLSGAMLAAAGAVIALRKKE